MEQQRKMIEGYRTSIGNIMPNPWKKPTSVSADLKSASPPVINPYSTQFEMGTVIGSKPLNHNYDKIVKKVTNIQNLARKTNEFGRSSSVAK